MSVKCFNPTGIRIKARDILIFLMGIEIGSFIYWFTTGAPPIFGLICIPWLMLIWLGLTLKEQKKKKKMTDWRCSCGAWNEAFRLDCWHCKTDRGNRGKP